MALGRKTGGGSRKGKPNKATAALKDMILTALEQAGGNEGSVGYLKTLATTNSSAFASLLGKVLPTQVTGEGGGPLTVQVVNFADHPPA